ncbi:iron ABC transporter permease [Pseudonocardiaceae bacterium YIM PH 21723]|nr:iron ABC transporter permease [Pseudonocardiaceae bacterium YIM PH 21723]
MTETLVKPSVAPGVRLGRISFVWRPWMLLVAVVLAALAFLLFCLSLSIGDFSIPLPRVVATLLGGGKRVDQFVIMDLRLPRALVGLIVGIVLGVSGALTQSLARNPLASPDVLGITWGASAAAVAMVTVSGAVEITGSLGLSTAALIGGVATGLLVYALAWRRGIDGFRLILIGVSVGAFMEAITTWLLVGANLRDVARAQAWMIGSLDGRSWSDVWLVLGGGLVLLAIVWAAAFQLKPMHFGDDVAAGLGVRQNLVRAVLMLCAVLLAGFAVSAAGPIPFIALVAPQIAMRVSRFPTPPLVASGLVGAALLLASDLLARTLLPIALPVGVVTAVIGGPFLIYLLVRSNLRRAS